MKNKKNIVITGISFILLICCFAIYEEMGTKSVKENNTILTGNLAATQAETPQRFGNINGNLQCHVPQAINRNNGFFAEQGQWIYYYLNSDFARPYKGGLYRVKKDGTEGNLLDADKPNAVENGDTSVTYAKSSINIINDWIYFESIKIERKQQNLNYITEGIYKVRIDGTGKIKISGENATNLIAAGDWLYYSNQADEGKIYRMRLDGTGKTKINDDNSGYLNIAGDSIYYCNYSDQKKPYKISINGSKRVKLGDTSIGDIVVDGNYVYFTNEYSTYPERCIYRMNLDGTDLKKIKEIDKNLDRVMIVAFNVYKGNVYYGYQHYKGDIVNADGLYCIPENGEGQERLISQDCFTNIFVADDSLYFTKFDTVDFSKGTDIGEIYELNQNSGVSKLIDKH